MADLDLSDTGPVVLIGAGKMGLALARGWLAAGLPRDELVLVDPQPAEQTTEFAEAAGVRLLPSARTVLNRVLVLAVKPQIMAEVMVEIRPFVGLQTLVVSIAAGISLATLQEGLGTGRIVRAMPNTPAQIGRGISGLVAAPGASTADRHVAEALLGAAGPVLWSEDEAFIDRVTAVSGSGPAYVFNLVEALAAAGEAEGLPADQAMLLARQTVIGAAALLEAESSSAATLRQNVTSPNGTTAAALAVLMGDEGLTPLMRKAVAAARRRSEELGRR